MSGGAADAEIEHRHFGVTRRTLVQEREPQRRGEVTPFERRQLGIRGIFFVLGIAPPPLQATPVEKDEADLGRRFSNRSTDVGFERISAYLAL